MIINSSNWDTFTKILYDDLRNVINIDEKITISTTILICSKDQKMFADLMYSKRTLKQTFDYVDEYLQKLSGTSDKFIDEFRVNKEVEVCFQEVKKSLQSKLDTDGYFKALYGGDPFAQVIYEITCLTSHMFTKDIKDVKNSIREIFKK